jgi:hypothetical protein
MAGVEASVSPRFKEKLPEGCPPNGAAPFDYETVFRFVKSNPVTDDDFASYCELEEKAKKAGKKAKGRPRSVHPCTWSATSLFVTKESAYLALPKPRERFKFLAMVKITKQCGVSILRRQHISFWRYETYVPQVHEYESL